MTISMTSLINTFNQLVNPEHNSVEPTTRKMGSLQDHLMSVSRPATMEVSNSVHELSGGPPPMYRKIESNVETNNVVVLPKRQGSRVIIWSHIGSRSSSHAA
jgi:hypothetical protein